MHFVKEVNPLKQGLKLAAFSNLSIQFLFVKEVNPLKQGLKQSFIIMSSSTTSQLKK